MTEIVLFHHAQGLTAGVRDLAASWEAAGHTVHTPDVYEGNTYDELPDGIAYAEQRGFQALLDAGVAAASDLPAEVVYAGISLGVLPAQQLAQNRAGARGALLIASCIPPEEFGSWPTGLPGQVHGMADDPEFEGGGDLAAAQALAAAQPSVELFVYPGEQHLFMDSSLAEFRAEPAGVFAQRALAFLAAVD